MPSKSVSHSRCRRTCGNLLRAVEGRDKRAEQLLWNSFYPPLVRYFLHRFGRCPRPVMDEEDLATGVMTSLFADVRRGALRAVHSWGDLRGWVGQLARCEFANHQRRRGRLKRGGGRQAAGLGLHGDVFGSDVEANAELGEIYEELMRLVQLANDSQLWAIVLLREVGCTVHEVADLIGVSRDAVGRKLKLLRGEWWKRQNGNPARSAKLAPPPRYRVGVDIKCRHKRCHAPNIDKAGTNW